MRFFLNTSTSLPPSSFFNRQGRAYPDVSAVGHKYVSPRNENLTLSLLTVIAGENIPVDGTSASAPIFAGIVSLLTDLRYSMKAPSY